MQIDPFTTTRYIYIYGAKIKPGIINILKLE